MARAKTEAQKQAQLIYMSKQARLGLVMPKTKKIRIQQAAEQTGMSMNEFVCSAIDEKLSRLGIVE